MASTAVGRELIVIIIIIIIIIKIIIIIIMIIIAPFVDLVWNGVHPAS